MQVFLNGFLGHWLETCISFYSFFENFCYSDQRMLTWSIFFMCFEDGTLSVFFLFSGVALFQNFVQEVISQAEVSQESVVGIFGDKLKNTYTYLK